MQRAFIFSMSVLAVGCPKGVSFDELLELDGEKAGICTFGGDKCGGLPCGPNSPVTNTFPVNGLGQRPSVSDDKIRENKLVTCNADGVQLLAHSLKGGKCGRAKDLVMQTIFNGTSHRNFLAGIDAHGTVVCQGDGLRGASFVVRSPAGPAGAAPIKTVFKFKDVRLTSDKEFEAYEIEGETDDPHNSVNACDPTKVNLIRKHMHLPDADSYDIPKVTSGDPDRDIAIAVAGPAYDTINQPIENTDSMFNIACAQDALAKRSVFNLESCDEDRNTDALRMLTATYCRHPYTAHGAWISWRPKGDLPPEALAREAQWDARKTVCFDTARLRYLKDSDQNVVDISSFPPALLPENCKPPKHCKTFDEYEDAIRAECDSHNDSKFSPPPNALPKCVTQGNVTSPDLESYIVTDAPTIAKAKASGVLAAASVTGACRKGDVFRMRQDPVNK